MEALSELVGLTSGELTQLLVIGVVLFVGLVLARIALKLTATLFRMGCFFILLIVLGVFVIRLFS
jgi:hypothetical protein